MQLPAMQRMTRPDLKDAVQNIINASKQDGVAQAFEAITGMLTTHGMLNSGTASAQDLMVHPMNRNGLGVNAFQVHDVGLRVHRLGWMNSEFTDKSFVFEVAREHKPRTVQLNFNETLVNRSNGLIAPLNGREKYLTVGSGHCAQFIKAVLAQCRSHHKDLAGTDGKLDADRLRFEKPSWKKPLSVLDIKIFSAECEEMWPELPSLAQAINVYIYIYIYKYSYIYICLNCLGGSAR